MLTASCYIALSGLALAIVLCVVRIVRGPDLPDRILAFDTLYINAVAALIVLGILEGNPHYFDATLLIALTGFVGTVALARYAGERRVID